jgi:hypothetical protein
MLQDATKLEFYSQKLDASLFAFGNHSKKRQETIFIISSTEMVTDRVLFSLVSFGMRTRIRQR